MPPWELWCAVTIEVDKRRLVVVGAVSFKPPTEYDLWGGGAAVENRGSHQDPPPPVSTIIRN